MSYLTRLLRDRRAQLHATRGKGKTTGLDDLPIEVAVAIESRAPDSEKAKPADHPAIESDSADNLVCRLTAIRERIWRLQAMFAVTLSQDIAIEANRYLQLFQELAQQLKAKDASALDAITRGHESLLSSPPIPLKQTIPLATQRLCELRWEVSQKTQQEPKRPADSAPEDWMLGRW